MPGSGGSLPLLGAALAAVRSQPSEAQSGDRRPGVSQPQAAAFCSDNYTNNSSDNNHSNHSSYVDTHQQQQQECYSPFSPTFYDQFHGDLGEDSSEGRQSLHFLTFPQLTAM